MTVFKGYLLILKRNASIVLVYLFIFFGLTMIMENATRSTESSSYKAQSVTIAYVDEDGGALSQGLKAYLGKYNKVIPMKNNKEKLQENLYYQNIEYIVRIPSGFEEKSLVKGDKLSVTKLPGSFSGLYVDQQIDSFLNSVRTYYAAGYSVKAASDAANKMKETKVTMLDLNGNAGEAPGYNFYFQFLPYLFIAILCYVLGNILSSFRKPDILRRMQASSVSIRRQNWETLLATGVFGGGLWVVSIVFGILLYGPALMNSKGLPYYLLNSVVLLFVSLALSYLVSVLAKNLSALNGIANTLSLGMCFLGGVFVPLSVMGKGVKTVAQFLPVYWYEKANDTLAQFGTITGNVRVEILQAIGIQVIFAAAITCVAMVISKRMQLGLK